MKINTSLILILTASALLTACANTAPQNNTIKHDRKQEVVYDCGSGKKKQTLRAMYALDGNRIAAVQIRLGEYKTPVLLPRDKQSGVFANDGAIWTAATTDAASIGRARGASLKASGTKTVKGKPQVVIKTLAQNCRVNRKASARANQAQ